MRPRRRLPGKTGGSPQDRWLVSYADFITLLLAFFVTMYAVTRLDSEKLGMAQLSIQRALHAPVFLGGFPLEGGVNEQPAASLAGDLAGAALTTPVRTQLEEVSQEIQKALKEQAEASAIRLLITGRGLVVHLPEFLLFNSGEATFHPEANPLLDRLAEVLRRLPNHVAVEGHTDNRPIHTTQFPSNWELSVYRATTLVRYLVEKHRLAPARFAAAGFGEYAPLADNGDEAGRRLNRRVDLIIKPLNQRAGLP
ncbi:MAG: flagellar motor protein MotB [Deltaproteobacteria bacterium]|nr:flagellar motor protein MotB [Deltaproteobacteria bacterium]